MGRKLALVASSHSVWDSLRKPPSPKGRTGSLREPPVRAIPTSRLTEMGATTFDTTFWIYGTIPPRTS
jgi:hypothetical protein